MNLTSNIAQSLKAVVSDVNETSAFKNMVYDPQLGFQSGVQNLRRRQNRDKGLLNLDPTAPLDDSDIPSDTLPLLIYNRSVLRRSEEYGRRAEVPRVRMPPPEAGSGGTSTNEYSVVLGEYDVNILCVFSDIRELEAFEVAFYSRAAAGTNHVITAENPLIPGDMLKYSVWWDDLQDIENILETNQYISVSATARVVGPFYLFKKVQPLILEVQSTVYT